MALINIVPRQCKTCQLRDNENPLMKCMKYGGLFPPIISSGLFLERCDDYRRM